MSSGWDWAWDWDGNWDVDGDGDGDGDRDGDGDGNRKWEWKGTPQSQDFRLPKFKLRNKGVTLTGFNNFFIQCSAFLGAGGIQSCSAFK